MNVNISKGLRDYFSNPKNGPNIEILFMIDTLEKKNSEINVSVMLQQLGKCILMFVQLSIFNQCIK